MEHQVKTEVGTIAVTDPKDGQVEITLTPSESHPGKVCVKVINAATNESVKLLWVK